MSRASLSKAPHEVAAMFDETAGRYDLMNDVMTFGQMRLWRRAVNAAVAAQPGETILDIAAGTGRSSEPFAAAGAHVVPADFSLGMLRVGKRRTATLPFTAADATRLPFADDAFDVVTMSYGLRNVVDTEAALREFLRVTRPGGRLVVGESSQPTNAAFRRIYSTYLVGALPTVARTLSSNPDSYVYLAESMQAWPDQRTLATRIQAAGWSQVQWRNLTGGIAAVHRAIKPA
ncbi:demethylmenaquinone methyltransferase [Arsenicicoccus sp. oral taxon 190]|uniref:demethylmenaquinone methyltransferase n=1 Tax=Arsenicicoccus sp. oral taxon 190 TaxID=1658671 RepID=UPI000679EB5F|nr:demethylmenaquinone methyltransferase [Arsenicicoccus sp. oral taxon 190]AKT51224.1 ubiquinone biosynthesis methyltransferase UbiE [Arsenicicoccus sp. oral taxon 190]